MASANTAAAPQPAASEGAAPARRTRKGLVLALATVLCAVAAAAAWWLVQPQADAAKDAAGKAKEAKAKPARPPVYVPIEVVTVNLRDDGGPERYLQVGLTFEVSGSDVAERIKAHLPAIRSRILLLLSAKRAAELATPEGKSTLVTELLELARAPLPGEAPDKGVRDVHFSAFIVQ